MPHENSITIEVDGRHINIPTVDKFGRQLNEQEAIQKFRSGEFSELGSHQTLEGAVGLAKQRSHSFDSMANAGFSIPGAYQPNILERVGAILQGQQDPIHKAQALDIEQKMGMARLNMQARKEEEDRKLKQLKGFGDILKFYKEFADYIPEENKDALAEKIATDAKAAGFSISDPKTFRQFLNRADEFSGAIDILQQGLQSGKPIQDATIDALKNAKDPESRKLLGDTLSKILAQKMGTGSFTDQVARELATDKTTGQIDPNRAKDFIKEMRTNPQGLESRAADIIIKKNKGTATPEELSALEEMKGLVGGLSAQRGAGGERGRLGVRSTPQYQQTEADIKAARQAGEAIEPGTQKMVSELDTILTKGKENLKIFKPEFTGVVPEEMGGTGAGGISGAIRQRMGNISDTEVRFRQNNADVSDALLRARSGAQINEQEYRRLTKIAPQTTDQPGVYKEKLRNFLNQIAQMRENKIKLATTRRSELGTTLKKNPPPPGPPRPGMVEMEEEPE